MHDAKILVVDDDAAALEAAVDLLRGEGYEVHAAGSVEEAEELLARDSYHLVISDMVMPGKSGLDLTRIVHENLPQAAVVVVTGHATFTSAVDVLKAGASDYMDKPIDANRLREVVRRLLADRPRYVPNRLLAGGSGPVEFDGMVARSPAMRAVFDKITLAAGTDTTVLVHGEPGTGKEMCALSIHRRSDRSRGPFVAMRSSSVPQELMAGELFGHVAGLGNGAAERAGRLEQASGGTLFIDDVDAMDPRAQLGLLRLLETFRYARVGSTEERAANVRVIAATAGDLGEMVRQGKFREDLYYRLNIFPVDLPPLRERREDIPPLVASLLEPLAARYRKVVPVVLDETLELLSRHPWPGNVRELHNALEHALIACLDGRLTPENLPRNLHQDEEGSIRIPIGTPMKDVERMVIARTLDAHRWNKNRTAKVLGISRRSLYNKLDRYQILRPGAEAAAAPPSMILVDETDELLAPALPPRRETRREA
jgi:DNA-binding NtrC family response regulator